MAMLGSIGVAVKMKTDAFDRGAKRVTSRVDAMQQKFASMAKSAVMVAAGYFSVRAFQNMRQMIDEQAKLARSMGISTQALREFQFAAELGGASASDMSNGLQRLARSAGQAAEQGGRMAESFARIGVGLDELRTLAPDEMMMRLADTMQGLSVAEQMNLAETLLGRSGRALVPFLSQGREAIGAERMREGGQITDAQARSIERMNDAISEATRSLENMSVSILAAVAPAVKTLAEALGGERGPLMQALTGLAEALGLLVVGVFQAQSVIKQFGEAFGVALEGAGRLVGGFFGIGSDRGIADAQRRLNEEAQRLADTFTGKVGPAADYMAEKMAASGAIVEDGAKAVEAALRDGPLESEKRAASAQFMGLFVDPMAASRKEKQEVTDPQAVQALRDILNQLRNMAGAQIQAVFS